jgi:hypothetical protein
MLRFTLRWPAGLTITEISRTLRLERKTVRRYATAVTAGQLIPGARLTRPGLLGPHQACLRQRWDEGARSTERLHAGRDSQKSDDRCNGLARDCALNG